MRFVWLVLAIFLLIVYFYQMDDFFERELPDKVMWFVIVGSAFFIIRRFFSFKINMKDEDREVHLNERTSQFEPDFIFITDKNSESKYKWSAIRKWEQSAHLYLLFVASNSAIIVPKRIFNTTQEQADFVNLLQDKVKQFSNLKDPNVLDA
jgi:hypothetical protein